jgi:hypothetical protein
MITLFALQCAVIAFTYSEILVEGGMILNPWYKFLERKIGHLPYLFKPLIECSKCVAGQISLWAYPFFYSYNYNLFEHIYSICQAILFALVIKLIMNKINT